MSCNHPHHHHAHDAHQHSESVSHEPSYDRMKSLRRVFVLTAIYFVIELIGGMWTGSLALLSDAGHMFADVVAIAISLFAAWFAQSSSPTQKTYGYQRLEVLAGLFNGVLLAVMSVWIMVEATQRFQDPPTLNGGRIFWIALGGLIINIFAIRELHGGKDHDLNVKGAYLHVLSDLLGSVGTLAASLCILWFGWGMADPVISMVIAALLIVSAMELAWQATHVLLESSPAHIDVLAVKSALLELPGVLSVHDLHVWTIRSGNEALTVHIVVEEASYRCSTLNQIQDCLKQQFGIRHATIQLESPDFKEEILPC